MLAARTRIRKVRLKRGGVVELLRLEVDPDRTLIEGKIREVLNAHSEDYSGFAFVVWGEDGKSTCGFAVSVRDHIPTILLPDFVRNRLLAERIETWTLESVNAERT